MMRRSHIFILVLAVTALFSLSEKPAAAQVVGIKTNLLYDATATINAGIEVGIAPRWTIDLSGNFNYWTFGGDLNMKWKHWMLQPELRYWLCQRFGGHFFALHALAGQFNFGNISFFGHAIPKSFKFLETDYSLLSSNRYEGWAVGGGFGYGYAFPIGKHWNLELELGVGAIYSIADEYECDICNRPGRTNLRNLRPAVTKAEIGIVYLF